MPRYIDADRFKKYMTVDESVLKNYIGDIDLDGMVLEICKAILSGIRTDIDLQPTADVVPADRMISVKDELPKAPIDNRGYLCRCIVHNAKNFPFYMVLSYYAYDGNPHFQHEQKDIFSVTHWMPLPPDPKEEK